MIENLTFLGWKHPDAAGYDVTKFEKVRLSDFYNPDGRSDVKLLAVNASDAAVGPTDAPVDAAEAIPAPPPAPKTAAKPKPKPSPNSSKRPRPRSGGHRCSATARERKPPGIAPDCRK